MPKNPSTTGKRNITVGSLEAARRFLGACSGTWVFLVYADWCPHCKVFLPEWRRFSEATRHRAAAIDSDIVRHVPDLAALLPAYRTVPFIVKCTYRKGRLYGAPQIADPGARTAEALARLYP